MRNLTNVWGLATAAGWSYRLLLHSAETHYHKSSKTGRGPSTFAWSRHLTDVWQLCLTFFPRFSMRAHGNSYLLHAPRVAPKLQLINAVLNDWWLRYQYSLSIDIHCLLSLAPTYVKHIPASGEPAWISPHVSTTVHSHSEMLMWLESHK